MKSFVRQFVQSSSHHCSSFPLQILLSLRPLYLFIDPPKIFPYSFNMSRHLYHLITIAICLISNVYLVKSNFADNSFTLDFQTSEKLLTTDKNAKKPKPQWRIVNGAHAEPGLFPWQLQLQRNFRKHCGATLIKPNWAVTAAVSSILDRFGCPISCILINSLISQPKALCGSVSLHVFSLIFGFHRNFLVPLKNFMLNTFPFCISICIDARSFRLF